MHRTSLKVEATLRTRQQRTCRNGFVVMPHLPSARAGDAAPIRVVHKGAIVFAILWSVWLK